MVGTAAAGALSNTASAQDAPSLNLNQYQHPVAGDAFFSVPAPWVGGWTLSETQIVPRAMVTFDYAKDPLVIVDADDNVVATPVSSQAYLHFGASLSLWTRLQVGLDFPLAVAQSGDDAISVLATPSGAAAGDLRISLRGRLFGDYYDPFQIGVGAYLFVPTGPEGGYTGEGGVYGQPHVLLGGRVPYFVWNASAGAVVRGTDNPHTFNYSAGAAVLLLDETLQIGPEIFGAVALSDDPLVEGVIDRKGTTNAEVLGGAKYRFLDMFVVGAAAGPGISNGVGTPQYRVLATLAFDPLPAREKPKPQPADRDGDRIFDKDDACPEVPGVADPDPKKNGCPPDRDGDGIIDAEDACIDVPGIRSADPQKNGCPPPGDKDGDGILDPEDACPEVKGVPDADPKKNGCPPDRDGDGVLDADDACIDVPGVPNTDPKKNGCPLDTDGDGIFDKDDACKDTPGVPDPDPKKHGCPKVVVTDKEIKILEKIEFEFDKANILPVSDPILDAVASTLKDNPDIELVEVQGHTDNKGGPFYNQKLSELRARAVRDALIKRGIDGKRLKSKGYGQSKPIAPNSTEEGRAENRRVQFQILKRAGKAP
jgi:outer membrane protein OmpA-like peptidoglycan-associated protein